MGLITTFFFLKKQTNPQFFLSFVSSVTRRRGFYIKCVLTPGSSSVKLNCQEGKKRSSQLITSQIKFPGTLGSLSLFIKTVLCHLFQKWCKSLFCSPSCANVVECVFQMPHERLSSVQGPADAPSHLCPFRLRPSLKYPPATLRYSDSVSHSSAWLHTHAPCLFAGSLWIWLCEVVNTFKTPEKQTPCLGRRARQNMQVENIYFSWVLWKMPPF